MMKKLKYFIPFLGTEFVQNDLNSGEFFNLTPNNLWFWGMVVYHGIIYGITGGAIISYLLS